MKIECVHLPTQHPIGTPQISNVVSSCIQEEIIKLTHKGIVKQVQVVPDQIL